MDESATDSPEPTLTRINEFANAYTDSRCLMAAVQLGLFSCMASGCTTVEAIARAASVSERGARPLLDTLCAMGLLEKKEGEYALTSGANRYLVKGRPDYIGSIMEDDSLWHSWTHLAETVQTGKPVRQVESQEKAEAFFPNLIRSLHVQNAPRAKIAARALIEGLGARPLRVLDVACGSGIWGISLAEESPDAELMFHDFPGVLNLTGEYVRRHGVDDRAHWSPGDLKTTDFGEARFDVAILGNIVHSEGEASSRNLFGRIYQALDRGGRIAVIDMVPKEDRSGPLMPVQFALVMLMSTEEGGTYTFEEYRAWLEDAGFREVQAVPIESHSPMIVAEKP